MNFKLHSPYIEELSIGDNEFLFDNGTVILNVNLALRQSIININVLRRPFWLTQVYQSNLLEKISESVNFFMEDSTMSEIFKDEFDD